MSTRQKKKDSTKPSEKPAVYTTIVGGRPPGCGTDIGTVPRGIEVLVKKASVDPRFRRILLKSHTVAAQEIGLQLTPAETAILNNIPHKQLEAIISSAKVTPDSRRAFLGKAASVMLSALGAQLLGCRRSEEQETEPAASPRQVNRDSKQRSSPSDDVLKGFDKSDFHSFFSIDSRPKGPIMTLGIQPDRPQTSKRDFVVVKGIQPDLPPTTKRTQSRKRIEDILRLARSRQYTVREGDSLWRIAAEQLGDGRRYKEILALNRGVLKDENDLTMGMQLNIPAY